MRAYCGQWQTAIKTIKPLPDGKGWVVRALFAGFGDNKASFSDEQSTNNP